MIFILFHYSIQSLEVTVRRLRARRPVTIGKSMQRQSTSDVAAVPSKAKFHSPARKGGHESSRQQVGDTQLSNSIRDRRACSWRATSRTCAFLRNAAFVSAWSEVEQCSDPRRWWEFRAAHSPRGLAASALRQAAPATSTSEHGRMHARRHLPLPVRFSRRILESR